MSDRLTYQENPEVRGQIEYTVNWPKVEIIGTEQELLSRLAARISSHLGGRKQIDELEEGRFAASLTVEGVSNTASATAEVFLAEISDQTDSSDSETKYRLLINDNSTADYKSSAPERDQVKDQKRIDKIVEENRSRLIEIVDQAIAEIS